MVYDFDQMVQWVVLKEHRQAVFVSEDGFPQGHILEAEFSDHHRQRILPRHANFQVRRAVTGVNGLGVLEQIIAQSF